MAKSNKVNITAGLFETFNFEQITVSTTVVSLTTTKYLTDGEYAKRAIITVEDAQIRYRTDGGNPSSSVGHILNRNDVLTILGTSNIKNFKAIKTGVTDGKISVSYEV